MRARLSFAAPLHRRAQGHDFVLERQRESEEALVFGVELVGDRLQATRLEVLQRHVDRQAQALAVIAQVDLVGGADLGARTPSFSSEFDASRASSFKIGDFRRSVSQNFRT